MSTLTDLLTQFPRCRVTIRSSGPSRPKPHEGDRRFIKSRGGWHVRMQRVSRYPNGSVIGYCVRGGRPVYDWVLESSLDRTDAEILRLMRVGRGEEAPKTA